MGTVMNALSEPFTYEGVTLAPEQAEGFDTSSGQAHHYDALFKRYADSEFGTHHAAQAPRYSNRYAYNPEDMLADLGDDAHPLRHMLYTESAIFTPLVAYQHSYDPQSFKHFSTIEVVAGRLGVRLHDIGECEHPELEDLCKVRVVGDLNHWEKNEESDRIEAVFRRYFYQLLYPDIPSAIIALAEDMIARGNEGGTHLRDAFATTEHIGYYLAGVTAGKKALELQPQIQTNYDDLRFRQLSHIAVSTTSNWHSDLIDRGNVFPYAWIITDRSDEIVDSIHTQLEDD